MPCLLFLTVQVESVEALPQGAKQEAKQRKSAKDEVGVGWARASAGSGFLMYGAFIGMYVEIWGYLKMFRIVGFRVRFWAEGLGFKLLSVGFRV